MLHSDICADFELNSLLRFHGSLGDGDHMTVMSVKARKEQAGNYGCLVTETDSFEVRHYAEKPSTFVSTDINAGVYVMTPAIFNDMKTVFLRNHDAGSGQREQIGLERDVLTELAGGAGPCRLFLYRTTNFWSQLKTAGSAIYANRHYLSSYRETDPSVLCKNVGGGVSGPTIVGDVRVHATASIDPTAKLGPNVSIGPGVRIGEGSRVRDSILLDGVAVGSNTAVLNAVIDARSSVGPND